MAAARVKSCCVLSSRNYPKFVRIGHRDYDDTTFTSCVDNSYLLYIPVYCVVVYIAMQIVDWNKISCFKNVCFEFVEALMWSGAQLKYRQQNTCAGQTDKLSSQEIVNLVKKSSELTTSAIGPLINSSWQFFLTAFRVDVKAKKPAYGPKPPPSALRDLHWPTLLTNFFSSHKFSDDVIMHY